MNMAKQKLTDEQKRLDTDLWIIILVTLGVFLFYTVTGKQLMSFVANSSISVIPRLLLNAGVQFGIAGLGITIVCIFRKENFTYFGLTRKNLFKTIIWTIICFVPSTCYIFLSGQFNGYQPFSILITDDVIASGIPFSILGMALIVLVWGFFEGFNYVVICDKINKRYCPRGSQDIAKCFQSSGQVGIDDQKPCGARYAAERRTQDQGYLDSRSAPEGSGSL